MTAIPGLSMIPLTRAQLLLFGLTAMPLAMLGIPLYLYLPLYYHDAFGMSLSAIGSAILAARLLDGLTDPLIGHWSDRWCNAPIRLGQWRGYFGRKGQMALGALGLLAGLYQLLFAPWLAVNWGSLWLWSFVTYLGWTLMQVPYQALAAELSGDAHQKTRITAYRESFAIVGVLLALSLPVLLEQNVTQTAFYSTLWHAVWGLVLLALLGLWLSGRGKKSVAHPTDTQNTTHQAWSLLKQLHQHSPQAFAIMPAYFLNNLANALPASLFIIFVTHYLQLQAQQGLFLMVYFGAGILALPVWLAIAKRFGKFKTWQLSMGLASVSFLGVFWLQTGDVNGYLIICVLTGLSLAIDLAMPASIQADISQRVAQQTQTASGLLFGLWGLLTKLSLGVAVGLSLPLLDWANQHLTQPNTMLLILYALIPIALKIIATWRLQSVLKRFDQAW
ncbi:MFS transporter [Thiomicrorhabdus aquaedulcis]|uniref:MFS transporter n=1 Tax=Thiomicrorhabdus aquaedulcis TaxID=2211106 RepID=UPI000FD8FF65|nr:MFS transporter [Thiomicrorhabdus aquaedulcis]